MTAIQSSPRDRDRDLTVTVKLVTVNPRLGNTEIEYMRSMRSIHVRYMYSEMYRYKLSLRLRFDQIRQFQSRAAGLFFSMQLATLATGQTSDCVNLSKHNHCEPFNLMISHWHRWQQNRIESNLCVLCVLCVVVLFL
jgi:hypothetical protein